MEIIWANRIPSKRKDMDMLKKIDISHFPSDTALGKLDKKTGIRGKPRKKKRWTAGNSFEAYDEMFWIVKKRPDGNASIFYHAYNIDTRNHIVVRETKSEVMQEIMDNYLDYMKDDF